MEFSIDNILLSLLIAVPIVAAKLVFFLRAPARVTALAAAAINVLLCAFAVVRFDPSQADFQLTAKIPLLASPEIGYLVGVNGISLILVILTVLVTFCAIWVARPKGGSDRMFYVCLLFMSAGALGAFCSIDLVFFYAFHELALIPTFLMIGIWGTGDRVAAAWKITIYLAVGSIVLLAGLIALAYGYAPDGGAATFDLRALKDAAAAGGLPGASAQWWIFLLLLIGFGVLISLFPFHSWAPQAYASAPAPTAMLHAGVLKKFGLYGLIQVAIPLLPQGASELGWLVLVLLLGNILIIGFVTIAQRRLDMMLGNSSVMHMGYIFLGIVSFNVLGLSGAVLLMFAHGVSIALLFALNGELESRLPSLEFEKAGSGLAKALPFLGLTFGIAAFAAIGLPGFTSFASEVMVFFGGFKDFSADGGFSFLNIATILALWGVVISAVYMLRAYRRIFMGPLTPEAPTNDLATPVQRIPFIILIATLLVTGFFPSLLLDLTRATLQALPLPGS